MNFWRMHPRRLITFLLFAGLLLILFIFFPRRGDRGTELDRNAKIDRMGINVLESLNGIKDLKSDDDLIEQYNLEVAHKEIIDPFQEDSDKVKYVDFVNFKTLFVDTIYPAETLRSVIDALNDRQLVYNYDKYRGNHLGDYAVIVVQVHRRIEYFKELLDSLQRSKGIENAVLVISHDFYSDTMNELIRQIKFCQVIQIFFPFSTQLYPDNYPGPSENDCPRDMPKSEALLTGCTNAETPDKYGHYREAQVTMTKHHWWWKINMVFDVLDSTRNHNGPFMFIEEDHYMAPSFYEALMQLHEIRKTDPVCKDSCDILTIGSYNNKEDFLNEGEKVYAGTWISTQHNMGMSMYRDTWRQLKQCAKNFCEFDDYNWDWSLMHLSEHCFPRKLSVLVYEVPRMFHIGDCGLHHHKDCTDSKASLINVKSLIERHREHIYVMKLHVKQHNALLHSQTINGGWGDPRDHQLCMGFVHEENDVL